MPLLWGVSLLPLWLVIHACSDPITHDRAARAQRPLIEIGVTTAGFCKGGWWTHQAQDHSPFDKAYSDILPSLLFGAMLHLCSDEANFGKVMMPKHHHSINFNYDQHYRERGAFIEV